MDTQKSVELVTESLERCAESAGDITPAVFERFFQLDREAQELMAHSDLLMQGRMLESVIDLLLSDEHLEPGGYLDWELDNHLDAYHATPAMYDAFFTAIVEVVQNSLGQGWQADIKEAWQARINKIMARVTAHAHA